MFRNLINSLIVIVLFQSTFALAESALPYPPKSCVGTEFQVSVCDTYKWCVYQGELMGNYETSYLKRTCRDRAMSTYDLSEEEFLEALVPSLIDEE